MKRKNKTIMEEIGIDNTTKKSKTKNIVDFTVVTDKEREIYRVPSYGYIL